MKQRLIYLGIVLFAITFISCDKEPIDVGPESSTSDSVVPVEDYCDGILEWLDNTYTSSQVEIDSVLQTSNTTPNGTFDFYEVYLSNGAVATFTSPDCQFLSIDCNCSNDYLPVCWNDETYDNECEALCLGADYADIEEGECDSCDCTNEPYNPVCWNEITFDNACLAICAGANEEDIIDGDCDNCNCANIPYDPVCWNGTTWDNACLAICEGANEEDIMDGECMDDCDCSNEPYAPVCWNDVTYNNECEALCAGANAEDIVDGECSSSSDFVCEQAIDDMFDGIFIINSESDSGSGIYTYNVTLVNDPDQSLNIQYTYNCAYYSACSCDPIIDFVCAAGVTNYLNECEALCAGESANNIFTGLCP